MKTEIREIFGKEIMVMMADDGMEFMRVHDGFRVGSMLFLGVDHSTGSAREDKAEYYEEVTYLKQDGYDNYFEEQ
jgi:3-isopropylmalate dehydratase small subunit